MVVVERVSPLLVGFDTETTGLDVERDEAISYGFAVFVNGTLATRESFFVLPDAPMHPEAERVHGVSRTSLEERFRRGEALRPLSGATRALGRLAYYAHRGATFVGANPMFDVRMLTATYQRTTHGDVALSGCDPRQLAFVDVVANDLQLDPDRQTRPRRGLSSLCAHYGVAPGGHLAVEDARAAVEVLLAQVELATARATTVDEPRTWRFSEWARTRLGSAR